MDYRKFKEELSDDIRAFRNQQNLLNAEIRKLSKEMEELYTKEFESLKGKWIVTPTPIDNNLNWISVFRVEGISKIRKSNINNTLEATVDISARFDYNHFEYSKSAFVYSKSKKFTLKAEEYRIIPITKVMELVEKFKDCNPRLQIEFEKVLAH